MKITMIASGSRGDVQPYLALTLGLKKAGHEVRFVTNTTYADLLQQYGVDAWLVEGDVQAVAKSQSMQAQIEGGNFIKLMTEMSRAAREHVTKMGQVSLEASAGTDVILGGLGGDFVAAAIGEKLHLPVIRAYLVPFTKTREFSTPLAPNLPFFKRASNFFTQQVFWQGLKSADNALRREVLGLPPAPFFGPFESEVFSGMPVLYGFSPSVIPKPEDWGDQIHVTGYWTLDAAADWEPDPDLAAYLAEKPAPVYIGFGSMPSKNPEETFTIMKEALKNAGQRAVISSGWAGFKDAQTSDVIMTIQSVPHSWLFPRVAAVVHHGGAGTTAAGLTAGVPSVVIPHFGDQLFWGLRVAQLGVGPQPIPRKKLTADRLSAAIELVIKDEAMQARAKRLGERIRAEDGVADAVEIIQESLSNR